MNDENKKYYIMPQQEDYFDSSIYYDENQAKEDHLFCSGNGFSFNAEPLLEVEKGLENAYYDIFDTPAGTYSSDDASPAILKEEAKEIIRILEEYFKKENEQPFTNSEVNTLLDCIEYYNTKNDDYDNQLICKVFGIIYGEEFMYGTFTGNSQGDWLPYFCPKSLESSLSYIEAVLMGTGTEYIMCMDPQDSPIGCFDKSDIFSAYTDLWREDDIKKWAASEIGCRPDQVEILEDYQEETLDINDEEEVEK